MNIDRVIQIIRESKRKSKCPPGSKYDKKLKSCVPKKYSGRIYAGYGRFRDEKEDGDDESKKNGKKNGNGNGSSGTVMVALGTVMVVEATVEMVTGVETEVVENEKGY